MSGLLPWTSYRISASQQLSVLVFSSQNEPQISGTFVVVVVVVVVAGIHHVLKLPQAIFKSFRHSHAWAYQTDFQDFSRHQRYAKPTTHRSFSYCDRIGTPLVLDNLWFQNGSFCLKWAVANWQSLPWGFISLSFRGRWSYGRPSLILSACGYGLKWVSRNQVIKSIMTHWSFVCYLKSVDNPLP